MATKAIYFLIIVVSLALNNCNQNKEVYLGDDILIFKGTAWDIAKAIEAEDTAKIKQIIAERKVSVNYQEPKFGESLLEWAVEMDHYNSVKTLLECGADCNLQDTYDGDSAFMYAAGKFETSAYVKLLLKYKGNPNAVAKNDSNNILCTPLISAAYHRLESVKLLVDAGANINYMAKNYECALGAALTFRKIDIVRYLLIDKKANFKHPFGKTIDKKDLLITDLLRRLVFPLNSKEYRIKLEIVDYLKGKGIDYRSAQIPKHYYKNYSKEFLDKY